MAILDILSYPHPALRKRCELVKEVTPEVLKLIDDLAETMYAAPGVGLAACQVGVSLMVAVIDVTWKGNEGRKLITLINPELIHQEGEVLFEEGCLSVPDFTAEVRRNALAVVRGIDRDGKPIEVDGTGLLAIALQHELDHLNGTLFVDRLSRLKRELFKKRFRGKDKGDFIPGGPAL